MTFMKFRNRGTKIEEEDFCHWTEKDVEFKCFEGLNARLNKFYSWNKAILLEIEIDGTIFCGCLYQNDDNNSFAPVKFAPPKRPPLPRIIPSKPKPPKKRKNTKTSSADAYSRENWPRVYIDPHNTVEQRLRFGRDKNLSDNASNAPSRIRQENSRPPSKKVGVLAYKKKLTYSKKSSLLCDRKSKNSAENYPRLRRSRRFNNSFCEPQHIRENDVTEKKSNNKSSAVEGGHATSKGNTSVRYEGKKCDATKHNLRPRRAKNERELEFVHSDSESNNACQWPLIDLTATEYDEIQHPTDIADKSIAMNESSVRQMSLHPIINPENEGNETTVFVFDAPIPNFNADETLKSSNKAKEEVNGLLKSKSKKKRRKALKKEFSDLSDKFEKMTIRASTFFQPIMQSSPKRDLDFQGVREEEHFKILGTEMQDSNSATADSNSATADSKPTNRSNLFFEEWCFIKDGQNASSNFPTQELRSGKKYQTT